MHAPAPHPRELAILMLEDSDLDAELIEEALLAIGRPHRIDRAISREDFSSAIEGGRHDLILADYVLPSFDGLAALDIARERCPDTPFVFVSGTLGEDVAVEALKRGATDYVVKQRLDRLPGTVLRALAESQARREQRRAEQALRDLNATLEQRVSDRTAELAAANARLLQEVEERRKVQAALEESEARYRAIFEHSPDAIFVLAVQPDGTLRYEDGNPATRRLLQELRETEERPLAEFPLGSLFREAWRHGRACLDQRRPVQFDSEGSDGATAQARETILVPILDANGRASLIVGSSRDVTARREAEEALRQAQKMEAVGQLTSGVAHDFNNLLAVISGNLELGVRRVGDAYTRERLRRALEATERASKLTQQLLSFARRQPLQPSVVDLGNCIRNMADLLARTLGGTVKVETSIAEGLWPVRLDPNQFELAVLNLAVNARDAMPGGGLLRIALRNETRSDSDGSGVAGDCVAVSLTDTGEGMPQEVLSRVFEPFFTTKEKDKGTGLGLSMVYGFAKQSQGAVSVDSRPGEGTTVTLVFPRVKGSTAVERRDAAPVAGEETARILVVEDHVEVGEMTEMLLKELGHEVVRVPNAQSGLQVLEQQPDRFELVVSDVMMPGMNGVDLAKQISRLYPDLRVLLTTGYSDLAVHGEAREFPLLAKPFTPTRLQEAVQRTLSR